MPGTWIKPRQVKLYIEARRKGHILGVAAAKAGISERSGHDIERGKRINPQERKLFWRTRSNPLEDVWERELRPMLERTQH